ncbi:MAG: N-acetylneuraminate synthase family protein [Acidobacteriia bacterium]|nr:N-acetylneuraminate synthase family protein [Terriglobia bacterium]
MSVFIVAEAGVNHNGDLALAKKLVDAAARAGVDAVKFQTWKPGECTGRFAIKVDYLAESGEADSRYDLSRRLCLPYDAFRELQPYCAERGVLFLSTPDGFESLDFLADELRMPIIKIGSTEVTHLKFIEKAASKQRPILLSTGLSRLGEIERCVDAVRRQTSAPLTLLQCTSEYPAPPDEVNLRAMRTLADVFGTPVGLSDHTSGIDASVAAVALGASVIEKHFTLDTTMPGPDHKASLDPDELGRLVTSIRVTERMLGDGIKQPTASERRNLAGIRRGVVAARAIRGGTRLTADMMTAKRPYVGLDPADAELLVGRTVNRDLAEDEPIRWKDVG